MIDPRKLIELWSSRIAGDGKALVTLDVRVAAPLEVNDKAGVIIRQSPRMASATVWRNGCTEWILVDERSGTVTLNEDREFGSETEILDWMNKKYFDSFAG